MLAFTLSSGQSPAPPIPFGLPTVQDGLAFLHGLARRLTGFPPLRPDPFDNPPASITALMLSDCAVTPTTRLGGNACHRLEDYLTTLSDEAVIRLTWTVEYERLSGTTSIPADAAVLSLLRPRLRRLRPRRVPTPCRLFCANFDGFLTNNSAELDRFPSLIARQAVRDAWAPIEAVHATSLRRLSSRLAQAVAFDDRIEVAEVATTVTRLGLGEFRQALATREKDPEGGSGTPLAAAMRGTPLAAAMRGNRRLRAGAARMLEVSPFQARLEADFIQLMNLAGTPRITDLSGPILVEAVACHSRAGNGIDYQRMFTQALMARLEPRWQITRFAKAVAGSCRRLDIEVLVASEFETTIVELFNSILASAQRLAKLSLLAGRNGHKHAQVPFDIALWETVFYSTTLAGLIEEVEIRKDSPRGLSLFEARRLVVEALSGPLFNAAMTCLREVLPILGGGRLESPSDDDQPAIDADHPLAAAAFLAAAAAQNEHHGFAVLARRRVRSMVEETGKARKSLLVLAETIGQAPDTQALTRLDRIGTALRG
ncbi:hypothetical protein WCLP8_1170008 [uncultured Gammaproteobacteria bacterium]